MVLHFLTSLRIKFRELSCSSSKFRLCTHQNLELSFNLYCTARNFLAFYQYKVLIFNFFCKKSCCICTASVKKLKPVLFSLTVPGNMPGLERAYEVLGITLATNGEPRLQPYQHELASHCLIDQLRVFL